MMHTLPADRGPGCSRPALEGRLLEDCFQE